MSGNEVTKVWQCIVCGKAWNNNQSLRAHMKVHKGEGYMRTSIIVDKLEWAEFNRICDERKTSSCMVMRELIKATLAGEKQGIVTIATKNPMMIQVNHVVLGAPRGRYSHVDVGEVLTEIAQGDLPGVLCLFLDGVRPGMVFCQNHLGMWISREKCLTCEKNRLKREPGADVIK